MTPLSTQVLDAASLAHIRFGSDSAAVGVAELIEAGARRFAQPSHPGGNSNRSVSPADHREDAAGLGLVMSNDRPTVECLLGAIAAGGAAISLPPPPRGKLPDTYLQLLRNAVVTHALKQIVARDDTASRLAAAGLPALGHSALEASPTEPLAASNGPGFRLVQYSSGSTAAPKPILLDDQALGVNVTAIHQRLNPRPGDTAVSWLPLSHDMGLIGMLLGSIIGSGPTRANGGELVLLEPELFLRGPARWLAAISDHRATITACPDFGLRWATQRPGPPVDLSSLRCVIVGGEIVRADTLVAVAEAFEPWGWRPDSLCPSYGLAELALAVTMTPPGAGWQELTVATDTLADGRIRPTTSTDATTLVACGPPLAGYTIRCANEPAGPAGSPGRPPERAQSERRPDDGSTRDANAPDRSSHAPLSSTGPLQVTGGSTGADALTGASLADNDGWVSTGDVGFVDPNGWLYITGRADDYVVANGRNLYAPALDQAAAEVDGVRAGRAAVIGTPTGELLVVAEVAQATRTTDRELEHLRANLRGAVGKAGGVQPEDALLVRRGNIPYTTSGKLRRAELTRLLLANQLAQPEAPMAHERHPERSPRR